MTARHFEVLAFRCDAEGIVEEVVADDLGLGRTLHAGQSMLDIIDDHSHAKARQFLTTVVSRQATSGWELNVAESDGNAFPAVFTGAMQEDRLFIVAGRSARDITDIVETLEQIGNEQLNAFRMAFRDQLDHFDRRLRTNVSAYEELSRLNNDLANAQRELSEKSRDLERLNEEKNRFLGMAAHDLRNPLSVILGYALFLAADAKEAEPEKKRMLDGIASASRFMVALIDDLLDVSQIEAGRREMRISTFDAVAVVNGIVEAYAAPSAAKNVRLSRRSAEESVIMTSDLGKLRQIVANLVGNAIKFSRPDTTVEVAVSTDGQRLHVDVSDQGIGIPADQLDAIFQPFVHLDSTGTAGERSTGLGLSIVMQLVDLLGGRINVESEVGAGSTFHLTLPLTMTSPAR